MERANPSAQIFRFGQFEADADRNKLTRKGVPVKVQDQPFRVLLLLLERPGEIVTREELRQKLWPEGTFVDFDGSLNVILKKLRTALDDDSDNPRYIETVPRHGYRFIAPVAVTRTRAEPDVPTQIETKEDSAATVEVSDRKATGLHQQRRPSLIYVVSAAAVLLLIVLGWCGRHRPLKIGSSQATAKQSVPVRKSVAVLGFRNVSGGAEDDWLATAFSEMLSTELATGEKLRLVSGEDIANLRVSSPWAQVDTLGQETAARIGTELNSDFLVLGSYTDFGPTERKQLRIDVRLQDAKTGAILNEFAETGGSRDLFLVTSRVGARLRERLGVSGVAETDEAGVLASLPLDRGAAKFYALGIAKLREFDALGAKDLLEQASKADPKFSLVHLMLARAWHELGYEQKRREETKKALDLSVDLPRAERMLVEGDYYESLPDHEKAASTYRALFELFPDSVEYGLLLATAQGAGGHASQALETLAQLRRLLKPASEDPRIDLQEGRLAKDTKDKVALDQAARSKASSQGKKLVYAYAERDECMNLIYGQVENPDQARAPCEDAYNIFLAAGNRRDAADAIRLVADLDGNEGHSEQAIATYQRALKILQELGEDSKIGLVLNNMAIQFTNQGKLDRAEQMYREAKVHFERSGDKNNTATALSNIADIFYLRGNLPAAASTYQQTLDLIATLDNGQPGYVLLRFADLELAQGQVRDAHRLAQQAVASIPSDGIYLDSAMSELGAVLESEDDLSGAYQQFEAALKFQQTRNKMGAAAESQVELAELALEQGHPEQTEPLLRTALAEFETEKSDLDAASAYVVLSRDLVVQGKLDEALKGIQHAAELSRTSPDPTLKLSTTIQNARIEIARASRGAAANVALVGARQQLLTVAATAKRSGYHQIEYESRLALGELELKANPKLGRILLNELADKAHGRGLLLISRKASDLVAKRNAIATVTR